jgi:hypothetical protein
VEVIKLLIDKGSNIMATDNVCGARDGVVLCRLLVGRQVLVITTDLESAREGGSEQRGKQMKN